MFRFERLLGTLNLEQLRFAASAHFSATSEDNGWLINRVVGRPGIPGFSGFFSSA